MNLPTSFFILTPCGYLVRLVCLTSALLTLPIIAQGQVNVGVGTTESKSVSTDFGGTLTIQPDNTSFNDGVLNIGEDVGTTLGFGTLTLTTGSTINADFASASPSGNFSLVDIGQGSANGVNPTSSGSGTLTQTGGSFLGPATLVVGDGNGNGTYTITGGTFASPVNIPGSHVFVGLTESSYSANGSTGLLTIGGTATVTFNGTSYLDVGRSEDDHSTYAGGTGTISQTGGTANFGGNVFIGSSGAGTGTYNLSGGAANYTAGTFMVGSGDSTDFTNLGKNAVGNFNQSGGTFMTSTGTSVTLGGYGAGTYTLTGGTGIFNGSIGLAAQTGSTGTINLNGGTLEVGGANGIFAGSGTSVIHGGGGTLQVINSSLTTDVAITLADNTRTTINTNGFDVTLNNTVTNATNNGGLNKIGSGNLNLSTGANSIASFYTTAGNINQTGGSLDSYEVSVGYLTTASYTMSGGTLTLLGGTPPSLPGGTAASLRIGDFGGTGTFTQTAGTVTVNGSLNIGNQGGNGTYVLSGGSLNLDTSAQSALGRTSGSASGSTGELDISGTGQLNINDTYTFVGSNWYPTTGAVHGNGVVNQSGGTVNVASGALLVLTGNGSGTYNLTGGTLNIGGSSLVAQYGGESGSYAFNFGGGEIQVSGSDLVTNVDMTLTSSTSSTIDTNSHNATLSGTLSGGGALVKTGAGTVTLTKSIAYTGGTTVNQGSLILNNTSNSGIGGSVHVSSGATLGGSGSMTATTFNIGGLVQVGNGINSDVTSSFSLFNSASSTFSNATLQFNLSAATGGSNELHLGTGAIAFGNSTLSLNLMAYGLQSYFDLIDNQTGSVIYSDLTLGGTDAHGNSIIIGGLSITQNQLFGSSVNGIVSTGSEAGSYLYLDSSNGIIGAYLAATTPEPSTWTLLLSGLALLVYFRPGRRKAGQAHLPKD